MGKTLLADIPGNFFAGRLGSHAALASGAAGAIEADAVFIAPADLKVLSVWKFNISASDVTVGTASSSASYRRVNVVNAGTGGAGTTVMASLNPTASQASLGTRGFAMTANNTAPAGAMLLLSHLTVGAAQADGTALAASHYALAYELL